MTRTRLHLFASRLHRWLAAIVGIQLLFWFASGAFMSFVPIERVRGEHLVDRGVSFPLPPGLNPAAALSKLPKATTSAELVIVDGRVVILAKNGKNDIARIDAQTGALLPMLDASAVRRIVRSAWKGSDVPNFTLTLLRRDPGDYRGVLPVWQAVAADADETRTYVSPMSGKILAVRTGTWRIYDMLWGLHIMDWKARENFNTPWLTAFALGGLGLAVAGLVLLGVRWPLRRRRRSL